jgi:hypothetical protein
MIIRMKAVAQYIAAKAKQFPSIEGNGVNFVGVGYFPYRHEIYTQWRGFSLGFLTE